MKPSQKLVTKNIISYISVMIYFKFTNRAFVSDFGILNYILIGLTGLITYVAILETSAVAYMLASIVAFINHSLVICIFSSLQHSTG